MRNSQRSREGYLLIDHRESPGLGPRDSGPFSAGTLFEAATYTCSHCQRVVVINPLRNRERGYCPKCNHRVCDECEAARVASGGECRTFNQIADEMLEQAIRGGTIIGRN